MLRRCLLLLVLVTGTCLPAGGCRSCSDCHDYDPPVMDCDSCGYGHRAGSACGCESCGTCGCGETHGGYEGQFVPYDGQPYEEQPHDGQWVPSESNVEPVEEEVGT
jgi:hypothetical protein